MEYVREKSSDQGRAAYHRNDDVFSSKVNLVSRGITCV
jgi:hypothetical protein